MPPGELPFFEAYVCASVVAWLVLFGRSAAAASAAASATACWARCARYQLPTSIANPAIAQIATMPTAVSAMTWPTWARRREHGVFGNPFMSLIESEDRRDFVPRNGDVRHSNA